MSKLNPPLPTPRTIPHICKCDEIRPQLLKAIELVTEKQAERRVSHAMQTCETYVLVSRRGGMKPTDEFFLAAAFTTDTLYAILQLACPMRLLPRNANTAFAMRFIIEGSNSFTDLNGRRITMKHEDVTLTPTWTWHGHGIYGSGPMIWLHGLDLPSFTHLPVHFVKLPSQDIQQKFRRVPHRLPLL